MKICVSALLLPTRDGKTKAGVGRHMFNVIDEITRVNRNHTFDVFVPAEADLPSHWKACSWVTWHPIVTQPKRKRILFEHWSIAEDAKSLQSDVFFGTFVALPIRQCPPVVSVMHDAFPRTHGHWFPRRQRLILDKMHQHAAQKSERIVTVSAWSQREISRAYNISIDRMIVAPNGPGNAVRRLSESELAGIDLRSYFDASRPYLFSLSTLEPRKNLERLIEAFALLIAKPQFKDLQLVVAGAKGWMESGIGALVKNRRMSEHVRFLGYVPDDVMNAVMQRARLFVCPSLVEGFGMPVLEAMIVGTPVACSQTSAIPEVAGPYAFYFNPDQAQSIASEIERALLDTDQCAEFVKRGLERSQMFTWEQSLRSIERAWREAAGM